MPSVSVIIATYNRPHLLPRAVERARGAGGEDVRFSAGPARVPFVLLLSGRAWRVKFSLTFICNHCKFYALQGKFYLPHSKGSSTVLELKGSILPSTTNPKGSFTV